MTLSRRPVQAAWIGGLCGLLLALLLFAPARWLAQAVAQGTGERVLLLQPRGTVWNGSARLVLGAGRQSQDRTTLPGTLRWRWQWGWPDGRPAIGLQLDADCCTRAPLALWLSAGWKGLRWHTGPIDTTWPAPLLTGLGTPWNTLQLDGQLRLQADGLSLQRTAGGLRPQGRLTLDALGMASRVSTVRPLGSYRLVFDAAGDRADINLQLQTLEGSLLLQGQGQWRGQRLRFVGDARAAAGKEAALANLLNIIGRRQGERSILSFG